MTNSRHFDRGVEVKRNLRKPIHGFVGYGKKGLMLVTIRADNSSDAGNEFTRRYVTAGINSVAYLGEGTKRELKDKYNHEKSQLERSVAGSVVYA
ncbi:MAG: hypothetical protein HY513_03750 [Candidatus Aenigmarchaeota archaeon]|nr:hypothetical protein [Candidatus Aenigmarchaeota archaeon]